MLIRSKATRAVLVAVVLGLVAALPASAIFLQAPDVPTDRLIKNLNAYLKNKPKDPQAHFLLGRVHYIAFALRSETIKASNEGSDKKLPNITDPRQQRSSKDAKKISEKQMIAHARSAIASFRKAIKLNDKNALYHLGLAGILEQSASYAKQIDPNPKPQGNKNEDRMSEKNRFIRGALQSNITAYKLDRDAALKKRSVFLPFYPVAYEAGKAVLRLVKNNKLKIDKDLIKQIKEDIAAIDKKPKAITPIVLRIKGEAPESLDELIVKGKTVKFDLDADGTAERRAWVKPDTAILVWDPKNTGKITSGKQLFGNMTFFMLFSDGYRALDVLDNNRDGKLTGSELAGLALWHDRNTNGVSDKGEVTPIAKTPIKAISTQQTGRANGGHPMNRSGITLDDGTTRPTWDWVIPAVQDGR